MVRGVQRPMTPAIVLPLLGAGVSADTIVDADKRETVLHELLSRQHPPPLAAQAEHPQVSLQAVLDRWGVPASRQHDVGLGASREGWCSGQDFSVSVPCCQKALLALTPPLCRGATPDLQDASGNTALHLLVVRVAKEKAFPDLDPRLVMQVGRVLYAGGDMLHAGERVQHAGDGMLC